MSHNSVVIQVGHATSRIIAGTLDFGTTNDLRAACSYEIVGAEHMKRSGRFGPHWDGIKRLYHKGHRTFGTGLLPRVSEILRRHDIEVTLTGNSTPEYSPNFIFPTPGDEWTLREDYQLPALDRCIEAKRGMIKIATGGGKTVIAGHLMAALGCRAVFLVHTKDLLYQALGTFRSMLGEANVGQVGDSIVDPRHFTVCTLQTAARALGVDYEKDSNAEGEDGWTDTSTDHQGGRVSLMLAAAGCVIMDECHRVAAPTAVNVVTAIRNAPFRFGFSASPWRDDGADLQLEAIFGEIIVDISASSLIEMGHLVKPYIRMRDVPPQRFLKKDAYATVYDQYVVNGDARNRLIVADASSKISRSLPTMVLVRQIAHGRYLADELSRVAGFEIPFLSGKDDSRHRNSVIQDLRDSKLRGLVATTIADEGLDIKPLSGLVLAGGGKSSTRALQRIGRVLRPFPGKFHAEISDFDDQAKFLHEHSARRLRMYESEPLFTVTDL